MTTTKEEKFEFYNGIFSFLLSIGHSNTLLRAVSKKCYFKDMESAQNILEKIAFDAIHQAWHRIFLFYDEIQIREPKFRASLYNFGEHAKQLPINEIILNEKYTYSIEDDEVFLEFEREFIKLLTTAREVIMKAIDDVSKE